MSDTPKSDTSISNVKVDDFVSGSEYKINDVDVNDENLDPNHDGYHDECKINLYSETV